MKKWILLILSLTMLSGCRDLKDMYNLTFPVAMAIDYQDEQYTVTFQIISSNSLSRNELESSFNKGEILITSDTGKTISEAIQSLENKMRMEIVLTVVDTIFLSPSMLEEEPFKALTAYCLVDPELRLTNSIFIYEEHLDKILQVKHNIFSSPYFSLMAYNTQNRMSNLDLPENLLSLMKNAYENDHVSIIPNMNIEEEDILLSEGQTNNQYRYSIDKITLFKQHHAFTFPIEEIYGLQYIANKENKNVMEVFQYEDTKVNYLLEEVIQKVYFKNDQYYIDLYVTISIANNEKEIEQTNLIQAVSQHIENEVKVTYDRLLDQDIDFLNLQELSSIPLTKDNIQVHCDVSLVTKTNFIK